jgi:hypothetical protein
LSWVELALGLTTIDQVADGSAAPGIEGVRAPKVLSIAVVTRAATT